MGLNMVATTAPASAVKIPLGEISQDVRDGMDEAYAFCQAPENAGKRLVIPFATQEAADTVRGEIRSYCEARPAGRLTASIWAGWCLPDGTDYSASKSDERATPALSLHVRPYVKRTKETAPGETADGGGS